MRVILALAAASVLSGCTFSADVEPSSLAAGEVRPDRRVQHSVSYHVTDDLKNLRRQASTGFVCGAHTFEVSAGPAIEGSIRSVMVESFTTVIPGGGSTTGADGAGRHVVFDLDDFRSRISFAQGFWTATAIARADLALRTVAYDENGIELTRSTLVGEGYSEIQGGCEAGSEALSGAAEDAIRRALEGFAHRMVNAGLLAEAPQQ